MRKSILTFKGKRLISVRQAIFELSYLFLSMIYKSTNVPFQLTCGPTSRNHFSHKHPILLNNMLKWVVNKELKDANTLFTILTASFDKTNYFLIAARALFIFSRRVSTPFWKEPCTGADIVIPRYVYSVTISRGWLL